MNKFNASLTEGPIGKNLIIFAVPLLLSNLLQQLYNSVDSVIVGRYAGSLELAAVGSSGAVINLLIGFFLGIATGTGILYAMHYGAKDYKGLKKLIDSALILSVGISAIISLIGIIYCDDILRLMNTPEEVFSSSVAYLKIIFAGTVVTMTYNVGAGMIRAEGDSVRPLLYLLIGGLGNLILDILLVKYFGLGAAGAAWATIAAQAVTAVLVLIRLSRLNPDYAFRPFKMTPSRLAFWDIIRISFPCGLQNSMYNISNFLVQVKINAFGAIAMAGVAAYSKIDAFIYMPMNALGLAISTFVGQNVGAGHYDRMKKGITTSLLMSFASAGFISIFVIFFYDSLITLFTSDSGAMAAGKQMMLFLAPFAWTYSITDTLGGAVRGSGQAGSITVILLICICVFRIIWLELILPFFPQLWAVNIVYPISWTICNLVVARFYFKKSTLKKSKRACG